MNVTSLRMIKHGIWRRAAAMKTLHRLSELTTITNSFLHVVRVVTPTCAQSQQLTFLFPLHRWQSSCCRETRQCLWSSQRLAGTHIWEYVPSGWCPRSWSYQIYLTITCNSRLLIYMDNRKSAASKDLGFSQATSHVHTTINFRQKYLSLTSLLLPEQT